MVEIVTFYLLRDKVSLATLAAGCAIILGMMAFPGVFGDAYFPTLLGIVVIGSSIFAWRGRKLRVLHGRR